MTSQLKVFINNISDRYENIQRTLCPGENKLSRFEQNRFYGNSLPRGRPSRDRPSCEVLSNPPLTLCEIFSHSARFAKFVTDVVGKRKLPNSAGVTKPRY